ncbi:MAG: PQ-loop repeat-containing protein [Dehalobacter sp. 4CP]|nr:PQ-loop repeat-containing protein [Dehalobacter sp. 4CP]
METTNIFQLLGTTGSLIMCASSVPQIIQTYRMKCADNLSGSYLTILMIGMTLILLYALHVKDIVFIFGNGISLTLTAILIVMRHRYNLKKGIK